jgi:hypothetical protein
MIPGIRGAMKQAEFQTGARNLARLVTTLLGWDGESPLPAAPPEPDDPNKALDLARAEIARPLTPVEQMGRLEFQRQLGEIDDATYKAGMERAGAELVRTTHAAIARFRVRYTSEAPGARLAPPDAQPIGQVRDQIPVKDDDAAQAEDSPTPRNSWQIGLRRSSRLCRLESAEFSDRSCHPVLAFSSVVAQRRN